MRVESDYITYVEEDVQFFNWNKGAFDPIGTPFCFEDHCEERYYDKEVSQYIDDVLDMHENNYIATIVWIDDDENDFVFAPGGHFANRIGYVVYNAEEPLIDDYYV